MLSFNAADLRLSQSDPTGGIIMCARNWNSLLEFARGVHRSIQNNAESDPMGLLLGLYFQLEGICRESLHEILSERVKRELVPDGESKITAKSEEPPTPGADAEDARAAAVQKNNSKALASLRALVTEQMDNRNKADKAWRSGVKKLNAEILSTWFPQTFQRHMAKLPISYTSKPEQGVAIGQSLLEEWCRKEKVDWKPTLEV
jgi:hypothetical protein